MNFLDRFLKKFQISNWTKIRPTESELFNKDGQTDMTKLIVAFVILGTRPKIKESDTTLSKTGNDDFRVIF
jgi:hypothetical protein